MMIIIAKVRSTLIVSACIILMIFIQSVPSIAEGTLGRNPKVHAYGVNRKVNSNLDGYVGVSGHFSASLAATPPLKYPPSDPENYNYYRSKPTAYLGSHTGESSNQVDAGLQYYNDTVTYPNHKILLPGWGPFINCRGNLVSPGEGFWDSKSKKYYWEGYRNSSQGVDYSMTYRVIGSGSDKGKVKITVNGGGLDNLGFYGVNNPMPDRPTSVGQEFPPRTAGDAPVVYSNSHNVKTLHMKRVIGMTQGNTDTYALDGSILLGTFSDGKLLKQGGSWNDWSYGAVEQSQTGYDISETAKDAQWDHHDTVKSQYIVTFPMIQDTYTTIVKEKAVPHTLTPPGKGAEDARYNADPSKYLEENTKSRYTEETVKISLRSATKITGEASKVRGEN